MQFIDLSIPITNDVVSDPPVMRPQIHYTTHETSWEQIALFFPGLQKEDLPDGEGWAVETLTLSTHNGTHMD
ncbi:MAG: cyclase family protein, partial [Brevundimonas sp.]|nr:cyclase family protein [Brevundimonas sp.]